ncbi:MAG: 7TM diverse intracellular signaling domain-containing protein [Polaromonas sp.]|nr:7TM diverse intracellular signaling domain-containing protein [Polaromonas sp.]
MDESLESFMDAGGQRTAADMDADPSLRFTRISPGAPQMLDGGALWLRFDAVTQDPAVQWRLLLPMSGADNVTLHFRTSDGQWVRQQAGDTFAMRTWPQASRHPVFSISHETGHTVRYYLEIRHARVPFSVMPTLVTDKRFTSESQRQHMLLGVYFGLAGLAIILALANAVAYRDMGFTSYAIYIAMFAGTQGVFTGIAGMYWWPDWPALNNAGVFMLPVCAAAAAMWFVRTVTTPRKFSRALDWLTVGLMTALPLVGLLDLLVPTLESFSVINTLIGVGMLVVLMSIGVSLAEGDRHARWVALGFLPVLLASLFPLLRNFGVLASGFLTEYAMILASAIEAPILYYGLHRRVSQRSEPRARASSLRTTDPLTGLHTAPVLVDKLRQALDTASRYPQPFALLLVNLTNHASLQSQHGREVGDRAMVMAAARLRSAARPPDTVARVGDSQFALLLEGPISAADANQVATKILASGLRQSNQLPDAESLLFHIAVGHLSGQDGVASADAAACLSRMLQALRDMNDGSRKAIRLVKL